MVARQTFKEDKRDISKLVDRLLEHAHEGTMHFGEDLAGAQSAYETLAEEGFYVDLKSRCLVQEDIAKTKITYEVEVFPSPQQEE